MCESKTDLEDDSITDFGDEDDSNGSEDPYTDEGDSGPTDSEYQGCDGGGCDVGASTEDQGS
ncbi:hypothetical protein Ahy_A08g037505 isoform B [Arachis hypogaea]|uniref:Uncharacterized protein n=1 Tax=Arachis hypogaea TaxID=3818 RepID=A0A445BQY7_ARAHY|nr:hypothetical protein Ahy_A08g037505 isoform B [Arachis hypogaea]